MLELDACSLSIGIASLITNLFLIRFVRRNDVALRLLLFSLLTDVIAAVSTIVTSLDRLVQAEPDQSNGNFVYHFAVPIWIFADLLQTALCFDYSVDRFVNFAAPILYSSISAISSSRCTFSAVLALCLIFSGLITYEVHKLSNFKIFNVTVASFLREEFFELYFDSLFWISAIAFLFCLATVIIASVKYTRHSSWEELQSNSYFLLPNTLVCVIRSCAFLAAYYISYLIEVDKELLPPVSRLLSTSILLMLQAGSIYLSLKWYNTHKESKKLRLKKPTFKRLPKNSTAAAILSPAFVIDATAMSVWSTPVINMNLNTKEFMEERANRERSVSFYQIVRHNVNDVFMPVTPFGDAFLE